FVALTPVPAPTNASPARAAGSRQTQRNENRRSERKRASEAFTTARSGNNGIFDRRPPWRAVTSAETAARALYRFLRRTHASRAQAPARRRFRRARAGARTAHSPFLSYRRPP